MVSPTTSGQIPPNFRQILLAKLGPSSAVYLSGPRLLAVGSVVQPPDNNATYLDSLFYTWQLPDNHLSEVSAN